MHERYTGIHFKKYYWKKKCVAEQGENLYINFLTAQSFLCRKKYLVKRFTENTQTITSSVSTEKLVLVNDALLQWYELCIINNEQHLEQILWEGKYRMFNITYYIGLIQEFRDSSSSDSVLDLLLVSRHKHCKNLLVLSVKGKIICKYKCL